MRTLLAFIFGTINKICRPNKETEEIIAKYKYKGVDGKLVPIQTVTVIDSKDDLIPRALGIPESRLKDLEDYVNLGRTKGLTSAMQLEEISIKFNDNPNEMAFCMVIVGLNELCDGILRHYGENVGLEIINKLGIFKTEQDIGKYPKK